MHNTFYNLETIHNLIKVMVPDSVPEQYGSVMIRLISSEIIPWASRNDVIAEGELFNLVRDYITHSFEPYQGSWQGAGPHDEARWTVYAILYGVRTADSLMSDFMQCKTVTFTDDRFTFELDNVKRSPNGIYYTDRQLDWAKRNAPLAIKGMPESELIEIMEDAILNVGDHQLGLPKEPEMTKEGNMEIARLVSARAKEMSIVNAELDSEAERIQWCLDNAPDVALGLPTNELLIMMQSAWESHLKGLL